MFHRTDKNAFIHIGRYTSRWYHACNIITGTYTYSMYALYNSGE